MKTPFKDQKFFQLRIFNLASTWGVEFYMESVKDFDKNIKEAKPQTKRRMKKAKNILLHHYKQMFITNAIYCWTFWLKEAKKSNHEEFDGLFILEKLVLIRTEILQQLTDISSKIGFEIDERDNQYMTDKMDFLQEQYKHLNLSDENSSKA